jgi:hypothetical protein
LYEALGGGGIQRSFSCQLAEGKDAIEHLARVVAREVTVFQQLRMDRVIDHELVHLNSVPPGEGF